MHRRLDEQPPARVQALTNTLPSVGKPERMPDANVLKGPR